MVLCQTEYISQGSLVDLQSGVSIARLVRIIADVEAALQHLHQQGFAHNFVSEDRILLRSDGSAVLVDYRWASPLNNCTQAAALCESIFKLGLQVLGVATTARQPMIYLLLVSLFIRPWLVSSHFEALVLRSFSSKSHSALAHLAPTVGGVPTNTRALLSSNTGKRLSIDIIG